MPKHIFLSQHVVAKAFRKEQPSIWKIKFTHIINKRVEKRIPGQKS